MRRIHLLSILPASLMLASCVSATAQLRGPESTPLAHQGDDSGSCKVENIVQNLPGRGNSAGAGLDPERISVLNWNMYKGKRENWAADFRRFSRRHDVITLQEAHLDDELRSVLDDGSRHWALNTAFDYRDRATGVMTLSGVKPAYSCGQRTAEPLIRLPKTSLISYYPLQGRNEILLVANIHGINFSLGVSAYKEQLEKLYAVINDHAGPVILAGDFNTWSEQRMQIVDDLAQRLGLESLDYTSHNRTRVFGKALDHVFYSGLEPLGHDTWDVGSSDHNPMRASFRVSDAYEFNNDLAAGEPDDEYC